MVTKEEIKPVLLRLLASFPESGHNGETITTLAEDWEEDLAVYSISLPTFIAAVKICRRECKFFPKIADVLAAAKTVDSFKERRGNIIALPESTMLTEEECQRNKKRIRELINLMDGEERTEADIINIICMIK